MFKHDFDHNELKGTKDDPVHRIPVIVEEAVETKKEPKTSYDPTAPVHVSLSQVEVEQDHFYVTLTAPPGTYKLAFEGRVIDNNFDWPRK